MRKKYYEFKTVIILQALCYHSLTHSLTHARTHSLIICNSVSYTLSFSNPTFSSNTFNDNYFFCIAEKNNRAHDAINNTVEKNNRTVHSVSHTVEQFNRMDECSSTRLVQSSVWFSQPTARMEVATAWMGYHPHGLFTQLHGSRLQPHGSDVKPCILLKKSTNNHFTTPKNP